MCHPGQIKTERMQGAMRGAMEGEIARSMGDLAS
jgi:hypothetical protein